MYLQIYLVAQSKMLTAMDLYDLRLMEKSFHLWVDAQRIIKMIEERKVMQADAHYSW